MLAKIEDDKETVATAENEVGLPHKKDWKKISPSCPWPRSVSATTRVEGVHWYAVHCAWASEDRVVECLKRIKYEIYIPHCFELRNVPKRELTASQRNSLVPVKRPMAVPLFPRYPFVRFDLTDPLRHEAFKLLGVQGMICDGTNARPQPAFIDDAVIERLMKKETGGALPAGTTIKSLIYDLGETVRIVSGPFSGHNAVVDEAFNRPIEQLDERTRIKLLIILFQNSRPIELSITDIEKL